MVETRIEHRTPAAPGAAHRRRELFVGSWKMEGRQHAGPFGPAARITATESFEWLQGGFFLVHRLEGRLESEPIACIEVMGHDAA
ncbi:MAG TPA: DUF1579 family protein, partial [Vicinamibacteria bacterium]